MAVTVPKFDDNILTPAYAEDADDFYKFLGAFATVVQDGLITGEGELAAAIKFILHDYLALVLRGDFPPFHINHDSETGASFRGLMLGVSEILMQAGVPMVEKNGKLIIDKDALKDYGQA